jgi:hypothetical protein
VTQALLFLKKKQQKNFDDSMSWSRARRSKSFWVLFSKKNGLCFEFHRENCMVTP